MRKTAGRYQIKPGRVTVGEWGRAGLKRPGFNTDGLDCADKNVYAGPGDESGGETQSSEIGPNGKNEIGTWKSRLKVQADERTMKTETGRINETTLRSGSHAHENGHNGFHRLNRYDGIEIYRFGSINDKTRTRKKVNISYTEILTNGTFRITSWPVT